MSEDQPSQNPGWWARVFGSNGAKASAEQRVEALSQEVERLLGDQDTLQAEYRAKAAQVESLEAKCGQLEAERNALSEHVTKANDTAAYTTQQIAQLEEELQLAVKANGGLAAERDLARERHGRVEQEKAEIQKRYQGLIDAQRYTSGALQQLQDRVRADATQIAELESQLEAARADAMKNVERYNRELDASAQHLRTANESATQAQSEALALRAELQQSTVEHTALAEARTTIATLATILEASVTTAAAFARRWFGNGAELAYRRTPPAVTPLDGDACRNALEQAEFDYSPQSTNADSRGIWFLSRLLATHEDPDSDSTDNEQEATQ